MGFHIICLFKAVPYLLVFWKADLYFMDSKWSWYNHHCFWRALESTCFGYSVLEWYVNEKCIWKYKCILNFFLDKPKHPLFSHNLNFFFSLINLLGFFHHKKSGIHIQEETITLERWTFHLDVLALQVKAANLLQPVSTFVCITRWTLWCSHPAFLLLWWFPLLLRSETSSGLVGLG